MNKTFRSVQLVLTAALLLAASAGAQSLDELRASGRVGERYDGYVAARTAEVPKELASKIEEINAKRREVYEQRAKEEGVPVEQVGRVYAKQIFESAPSGTWFLRESGEWVQKP